MLVQQVGIQRHTHENAKVVIKGVSTDKTPTKSIKIEFRLAKLIAARKNAQVVSIHQTDAVLMERGIYGLGGFLKVAKELRVLWSPPYLSRLPRPQIRDLTGARTQHRCRGENWRL